MKQATWIAVALTLALVAALPAPSLAAGGERSGIGWWVDLRGSFTASVPDLEHPDDPTRREGSLLLSSQSPTGGSLFLSPARLSMDDLLEGDLAWSRGVILGGGLEHALPGQGSIELLLGVSLDAEGSALKLRDEGSRLRLGWPLWRGRLVLELLPFGSTRSGPADGLVTQWGGQMDQSARSPSPALRLAHFGSRHELFADLEGRIIDQWELWSVEKRASYFLSLGGALRLGEHLRLHLGLAHSLVPPRIPFWEDFTRPVGTRGATLGLDWGSGAPPPARGQRLPLVAEPGLTDTFFDAVGSKANPWWNLRLEWSWLQQQLLPFNQAGRPLWEPAWTVAAVASGGWRNWTGELGYLDESVAFLAHPSGGLVPFVSLSSSMEARDGHRAWLHLGKALAGDALELGFTLGVRRPASVTVEAVTAGPNPSDTLIGQRTVLVRDAGRYWVLPDGAEPVLELDARAELVWRINDVLVLGGQLFMRQNGNRAEFQQTSAGETVAVFADPFSVGVNLALRFRFAADSSTPWNQGKQKEAVDAR